MVWSWTVKTCLLYTHQHHTVSINNLLDFFRGSLVFLFEGDKTGSATEVWELEARITPKFLRLEHLHSLFDSPSSTLKPLKINFIEPFPISWWQPELFIGPRDWEVPMAWWNTAAAILKIQNIPSDDVSTHK